MTGYYWGTAGWQDNAIQSASRDRAIREASDGTLSKRLEQVVDLAYRSGTVGITFKDVDKQLGTHHGQSSGALSNLHRQCKLFRLTEYRRDRCSVYIHPYFADRFNDREYDRLPSETEAKKRLRLIQELEQEITQLTEENDYLKKKIDSLSTSPLPTAGQSLEEGS
jgi:hypothetical protein